MLWFDKEHCVDKCILHPFGSMIYHTQIQPEFLGLLQNTAKKSKDNGRDRGNTLAGNIASQRQAVVDVEHFMDLLYPHVLHYARTCYNRLETNLTGKPSNPVPNIKLHLGDGPWINYQKQGEFNPVHAHGGILSAVVMIDVPEVIATEADNLDYQTNMPCPGQLEFINGPTGWLETGTFRVVPKTGDIYLFPADLKHCVYPFTSDVERVTMSFNVFDIEKVYDE